MTVGFAAAEANAMLTAYMRGTAYNGNATPFAKLHVGDPGAAGASNAAGNTTRQAATFGSNASGGVISNTAQIQWTGVSTAEDYTHVSLWTASSGGSFLGSGPMTANAVQVGDTFTIPTGDLDISLAPLAA